MKIYQIDRNNFYCGVSKEWTGRIAPVGWVAAEPPVTKIGFRYLWQPAEKNWKEEAIPEPTAEQPTEEQIAEIKKQAITALNAEASQKILAGFDFAPTSTGTTYHFSYDEKDQINFINAFNAVTIDPNIVTDWNGWIGDSVFSLHLTSAEFNNLYQNGAMAHKNKHLAMVRAAKAKIQELNSINEIWAVTLQEEVVL